MNLFIVIGSWALAYACVFFIAKAINLKCTSKKSTLCFYFIHLALASVLCYLFFYFYNSYLYNTLNEFDLNNNGMFEGNEVTVEQKLAMDNWVNDSGRNLFKFLSIPIYTIINIIIVLADRNHGVSHSEE